MHRTAWLVGLVGCYSPSYQSGTPCTSACPGDLVCIDQVCREPGYVPPADGAMTSDTVDSPPAEVDVDGDGLVGAADNCPAVANADQHDEDGDQHGDACDPCPHVAGTLADGDGDGIGDACDPQPQIAKQVLRFFDPFTSDRSEWMHDTGVTRVGEDLRLNGSQFSQLPVTTGALRIAIGGSIASAGATPVHQVAIGFGANAMETRYHYCEFYDEGGGGGIMISEAIDDTYPTLAEIPYQGTLPTGAFAMQIDESVAAQEITFSSTLGGQARPPLSASTQAPPPLISGSGIGLWVENVDARIHYVWIVETLP